MFTVFWVGHTTSTAATVSLPGYGSQAVLRKLVGIDTFSLTINNSCWVYIMLTLNSAYLNNIQLLSGQRRCEHLICNFFQDSNGWSEDNMVSLNDSTRCKGNLATCS
ncbi:hypothetical protein E2C01_018120 [Portunus trituberculatus]|uniref:Uncharacterized protein n=1 Tax=Portunus trituberculatus TaxID=210409 RepID=A0A5B7DVK4_PORTR|nr:hypothetical protein [Portunus trituberculatus]